MIKVQEAIAKAGLQAHMLLQVHDELILKHLKVKWPTWKSSCETLWTVP